MSTGLPLPYYGGLGGPTGADAQPAAPPVTYPATIGAAPDNATRVDCRGCRRLIIQIANNPLYITFGRGPQDAIQWDVNPEPFMPCVGELHPPGGFDAFRWQALVPAAQIPAGSSQAYAYLIPIV